jgi:hypothetical protein
MFQVSLVKGQFGFSLFRILGAPLADHFRFSGSYPLKAEGSAHYEHPNASVF